MLGGSKEKIYEVVVGFGEDRNRGERSSERGKRVGHVSLVPSIGRRKARSP